jgi:hypothetical protein
MDGMELAEKFGLPGLMLIVIAYIAKLWIASNERVQMDRTKVEDKKADAMTAALASLSGKVDAHHTADLEAHGEMSAASARIESKLDAVHGFTPVRGVPSPPRRSERPPSRGHHHDGEDE